MQGKGCIEKDEWGELRPVRGRDPDINAEKEPTKLSKENSCTPDGEIAFSPITR